MLQAHSLLWYYLWVAPHILQLVLAALMLRRGMHVRYPFLFTYLIFEAFEELLLFRLDIAPGVDALTWWRVFWVGAIPEGILKFAVVAEVLRHLLQPWAALARVGRNLIGGAGVVLVLSAAVVAAFAAPDKTPWLVGGAHILLQTLYFTQAGLILAIFLFAAYFHVGWDRVTFGTALGLGLVCCEHLAIWALVTGGIVRNQDWTDFVNMGTYHVCVLLWFYYLLVPQRVTARSGGSFPDNNLAVWNRELERLVHQ